MTANTSSFTLQANPGTDIWRKAPSTNVWNAPISRTTTGLLKKFRSARVTFWAPWAERYDQAGLLLVPRRAASAPPTTASPPEKWVKTGIEYYHDQPQLSTVGCDRWADWGIGPLGRPVDPARGVTLEAVREADENGRSVWVYQLVLDPATGAELERIPLREICWILADEDEDNGEGWVLDVSPLIARPEKNATTPLSAEFKEFTVVWD
ncbi:hypothetical protein SAMD00023353_1701680 [Rosellinia necatrix]|uniref:Uncharacterized protein n=1 Tax=Rosellinia necatrix TaxID=77044 RepID=A0A1W2TJT4_ROSNE|nr:hypothetical protein SAMD00023353_1701680 [Rosellinia necatrix]